MVLTQEEEHNQLSGQLSVEFLVLSIHSIHFISSLHESVAMNGAYFWILQIQCSVVVRVITVLRFMLM